MNLRSWSKSDDVYMLTFRNIRQHLEQTRETMTYDEKEFAISNDLVDCLFQQTIIEN